MAHLDDDDDDVDTKTIHMFFGFSSNMTLILLKKQKHGTGILRNVTIFVLMNHIGEENKRGS